MTKPPVGVMPEYLWRSKYPYPSPENIKDRIESLEAACYRFIEGRRSVPGEWLGELDNRRLQLEVWSRRGQ